MYQRILVVVTGDGATSRIAVKEGVALAQIHDAEVHFFHVLPRYIVPVTDIPMMGMPMPDQFLEESRANGERMLATARQVADEAGVGNQSALGSGADDAECIVEAVRKRRCGLVVVASSGRNALMRMVMGSVIPGLITMSPVPVLVCRRASPQRAARRRARMPPRSRVVKASVNPAPTRVPIQPPTPAPAAQP